LISDIKRERRLGEFDNRVLRKILGEKRDGMVEKTA
jgi:hypothetical protein